MIDKESIKQEIKRLKRTNGFLPVDNHEICDAYRARGYQLACDDILQFIDSLPEEPVKETIKGNYNERYKRIAQTEQFKKTYGDKSLGKEEPAIDDLEEVADNYAQQHNELLGFDCDCEPIQTGPELKKAIIFGAEWQRKKDQEIDKLTESSDLDESSWKYSDRDGITYGQRYAMQIDFKAGAKWQKQKDFQDFLEKAEMYLKTRVYYNMHPNNVTTAIQEFKNYIKNES